MHILLVEDDELTGCSVKAGLCQAGFTVDWTRDGHKADLALVTTTYALVILDLGLPGISGAEPLERLRGSGNDVPVLILAAKGTAAHRVLDAGADDYLDKPFDLSELIARCRALLRRSQRRSVNLIQYRDLTISTAAKTIAIGDAHVTLTSREWAILIQLLTNQGIPQSRTRLEESLYGWQKVIESNAIEVHVAKLRKKLGANLIRTVRGIGYVVEKA
ncbi:DNA-binding response regulator [Burkholderia sp. SRS-46]|nr:DNA-binding response regulator [Burkholderia sp. SRS-46]